MLLIKDEQGLVVMYRFPSSLVLHRTLCHVFVLCLQIIGMKNKQYRKWKLREKHIFLSCTWKTSRKRGKFEDYRHTCDILKLGLAIVRGYSAWNILLNNENRKKIFTKFSADCNSDLATYMSGWSILLCLLDLYLHK